MDAAYSLLIEEYTRVGISMLDALDQTSALRAGGTASESQPDTPAVQSEAALAKQNDAAMRELQRQMGGL